MQKTPDRNEVVSAVNGRWRSILHSLCPALRPALDSTSHVHCPLPGHEDRNPSFRWDDEKERFRCTCDCGDNIGVLMKVNGWDFKKTLHEIDGSRGSELVSSEQRPRERSKVKKLHKTDRDAITACRRGVEIKGFKTQKEAFKDVELVDRFDFVNLDSTIQFSELKFEYTDKEGNRCKTRRIVSAVNGGWKAQKPAARPVLFNLPAVMDAVEKGDDVYVTEGPKDARTLNSLGAVATCSAFGSSAANASSWQSLTGARVVLFRDTGSAGEEYVTSVAALLDALPVRELLEWPNPLEGDNRDVTDWIEEVHEANDDHAAILAEIQSMFRPYSAADSKGKPSSSAKHSVDKTKRKAAELLELTEAANGRRIANDHGENVRWCAKWKTWLIWDGKRWREDERHEAESLAKASLARLFEPAVELLRRGKPADKELHLARSSNTARGMRNALDLAKSEPGIAIVPTDLNSGSWLLNVANGTIDLRSSLLRPHDREDLISNVAPVAWDTTDVDSPHFDRFLLQTFPDEQVRRFVQRGIGMSLVGETREHTLFLCYGTGANGKSTFLNLIHQLLGDYAYQAPSSLFLSSRSDSTKWEIADLFGKRFVAASEAGAGRELDEVLIKQLSGGDILNAQRKHRDPFTFVPSHTLWLACNHRPRIRGQDDGIWRRVMFVPFDETVAPEERDPELPQKLASELPAVLNWALSGLAQWRENGLSPPDAVLTRTNEYRRSEDVLSDFFDDRLIEDPFGSVASSELHACYRDWCESQGLKPWSIRAFVNGMEERGWKRKKTSRYNVFEGLQIQPVEAIGG